MFKAFEVSEAFSKSWKRRFRSGRFAVAVAVGTAWSLIGCAGAGTFTWVANVPDHVLRTSPTKEVVVGDIVGVHVFSQDALTVRTVVREHGSISVPLIGEVRALGRQPVDISKEITQRLEPFVNRPYVMTVIEETHIRVVMAGELQRPGTLSLDGSVDLLTAIANAGGLTQYAGESDIFVLRPIPKGVYRIRFRWDEVSRGVGNAGRFRLRDGDQVVVE